MKENARVIARFDTRAAETLAWRATKQHVKFAPIASRCVEARNRL